MSKMGCKVHVRQSLILQGIPAICASIAEEDKTGETTKQRMMSDYKEVLTQEHELR